MMCGNEKNKYQHFICILSILIAIYLFNLRSPLAIWSALVIPILVCPFLLVKVLKKRRERKKHKHAV
ncbi:MAG: hypothetical protein J0H68_09980 [Sphingobacteriia bacterium]|nr:hypothetical protein [Sphingobacteriia bacterium]